MAGATWCRPFGSFSLRELTCMHCVYLALWTRKVLCGSFSCDIYINFRSFIHSTAAASAQVLCTPYNHAPCHFMQSHIRKVCACLAVTCHLHFWQNDQDILRATAVTRGMCDVFPLSRYFFSSFLHLFSDTLYSFLILLFLFFVCWVTQIMVARLHYLRLCLFEMYVNFFFFS